MTRAPRTLFTLLLSLSLLGGWTVQAATSCGGPCCATAPPVPSPMSHHGGMGGEMASGCCCCGGEAVPCDLEQEERPDEPPRALTAAPKVEPPAAVPIASSRQIGVPGPSSAGVRWSGRDPPDRSPPNPLFLQHQSFLC